MRFLSKEDQNFLVAGIFGNGPTVVSRTPMVRRQGNGNFCGFVREVWSDGTVIEPEFVMNARSIEDVRNAYKENVEAA